MISSKNIMIGLLGTAVLVSSSPAMSGKWTTALDDEKETRSTLLLKCQEGLKNTAKKETQEEEEKWALWGKRFQALMKKGDQNVPLTEDEYVDLRSLVKSKGKVVENPSTSPVSSVTDLEEQLRILKLQQEIKEQETKLLEEEKRQRELKQSLAPKPEVEETENPKLVEIRKMKQRQETERPKKKKKHGLAKFSQKLDHSLEHDRQREKNYRTFGIRDIDRHILQQYDQGLLKFE